MSLGLSATGGSVYDLVLTRCGTNSIHDTFRSQLHMHHKTSLTHGWAGIVLQHYRTTVQQHFTLTYLKMTYYTVKKQ